jgi:hypothetical protein
MDDLRRLSSVSRNPLTRELLAAGRADAPSRDARRTAAVAIGIAATVATTATAGGAAAGTATGTVAASKWLGGFGLLKLVGATVVSGAVVVGAAHEAREIYGSGSFATPTPALTARAHVSAPPSRARVGAPAIPAPSAASQVALDQASEATPAQPSEITLGQASQVMLTHASEASAPVATSHAPVDSTGESAGVLSTRRPLASPPILPRTASPRVAPVPEDALRNEVERLDHARATLGEGRAAFALAELKSYERAFPRGALRDEAELLRIEALAQAGEVDAARGRAERLLAGDERGPHARRVRALLASLRSGAGAH